MVATHRSYRAANRPPAGVAFATERTNSKAMRGMRRHVMAGAVRQESHYGPARGNVWKAARVRLVTPLGVPHRAINPNNKVAA